MQPRFESLQTLDFRIGIVRRDRVREEQDDHPFRAQFVERVENLTPIIQRVAVAFTVADRVDRVRFLVATNFRL